MLDNEVGSYDGDTDIIIVGFKDVFFVGFIDKFIDEPPIDKDEGDIVGPKLGKVEGANRYLDGIDVGNTNGDPECIDDDNDDGNDDDNDDGNDDGKDDDNDDAIKDENFDGIVVGTLDFIEEGDVKEILLPKPEGFVDGPPNGDKENVFGGNIVGVKVGNSDCNIVNISDGDVDGSKDGDTFDVKDSIDFVGIKDGCTVGAILGTKDELREGINDEDAACILLGVEE